LRVHVLQHVPFEGLGTIQPFFLKRGLQFSMTHLYRNACFPGPGEFDFLVIMGGPMGVHDTDRFPWLQAEKAFIKSAIERGKTVLGVCLGAQLIADVLGAEVASMGYREIGWFPVELNEKAPTAYRDILGDRFVTLHWHGDSFAIPPGASLLGSSEACQNQGFVLDERIVGLQFHLEFDQASINRLTSNCAEELDGSRWVQSAEEMSGRPELLGNGHARMDRLLDHLIALTRNTG
jgi:GMP synthase-like glutamine amidotransferase